jgi:predicted flap endonuclease-1-like 5' DNA nuclease
MGKGLQVLVWGALTGLTAFLAVLVKQKNTALELAQARLARLEQRMGQLAGAPAETSNTRELLAQLVDKTEEVAQLRAQLAAATVAVTVDVPTPAAITRQASSLPSKPDEDLWRQRLTAETGWHAKAPGLVMIGRAVDALPPAKLAYANRAVQARIVPEVTPQPQDLSAIAGVGAIYEQRLNNAGIGTYWEVATLDDDALRRILKVDKARALTVDLDALRASARTLAAETETTGYIWNGEPVDDFEPIKGIGKVYEQRLYNAGIRTYTALASTTPEQLLEIVQARSPIPPDVASWISQALALAAQAHE